MEIRFNPELQSSAYELWEDFLFDLDGRERCLKSQCKTCDRCLALGFEVHVTRTSNNDGITFGFANSENFLIGA
jgi:hypothetical protein